MEERSFQYCRRDALRKLSYIAAGLTMLPVVGCTKMIVASGKLLWGDPKLPSEFTNLTKEDLTKGIKTVLVACSTPEAVEADVSTLKLDLIDGITRRMKRNGVKIINPDRVAEWIDDHGGVGSSIDELAQDFDTDYIAWVDVQNFSLREPNSPKLLRGNASGYIKVFKVEGEGNNRRALRVYQTEFSMNYPQHQPISETGRSATVFHKDYVDHLSDLLAERFYDHRPGTNF